MAEEWKKVDLTKFPFMFNTQEGFQSSLGLHRSYEDTDEGKDWLSVYNIMMGLELGNKNLEYLWSEEGGDEPDSLDEFNNKDWDLWMVLNAKCNQFGYVTAHRGKPYASPKRVGWVINFEMLTPIWIREV